MKDMRVIGATIREMANAHGVAIGELADVMGCKESQVEMGLAGRGIFSYIQLKKLANFFQESIDKIVDGDEAYYSAHIVDCMVPFSNGDNREMILDLIYDYLDILDCVEGQKA